MALSDFGIMAEAAQYNCQRPTVTWEQIGPNRHEGVTVLDLPNEDHRYFVVTLHAQWLVRLYSLDGTEIRELPADQASIFHPDGWPTLRAAKAECERHALWLHQLRRMSD